MAKGISLFVFHFYISKNYIRIMRITQRGWERELNNQKLKNISKHFF